MRPLLLKSGILWVSADGIFQELRVRRGANQPPHSLGVRFWKVELSVRMTGDRIGSELAEVPINFWEVI